MSYRKLGRTSSQRKAMLRDLTTDLFINELPPYKNNRPLFLRVKSRLNLHSN